MSRIDRIRRAAFMAGSDKAELSESEAALEARIINLPTVVPARPPRRDPEGAAAFAAQLMGQDGQKRGLRAGPPAIEAARGAYNRIEWSGSKDRRARVGRKARTEV